MMDNDSVILSEVGESSNPSDDRRIVVPITVAYTLIFISGVIGNVSTCIVIARNRHMHTATNYYLFSLAVSDLLLLVSALPQEVYLLWYKSFVFGEAYCVMTAFMAETCANATVLTITAFTVERYVAICHPFLSHTVTKLSRAVKFVIAIWLLALCLAVPQAIQFGVIKFDDVWHCSMKMSDSVLEHAFEISTAVFFVAPMSLITGLYLLIGAKLRRTRLVKRPSLSCMPDRRGQNHVIRMLVAVVVAFFICWAPFHAQRIMAVYVKDISDLSPSALTAYSVFYYMSGILYYVSTTINPLLYNIMSHKFRQAFKETLAQLCGRGSKVGIPVRSYSILSRANTQLVHMEFGDGGTRRLRFQGEPPKLQRAATISNSSLQDLDEAQEFTGSELAQYMGQLNTR